MRSTRLSLLYLEEIFLTTFAFFAPTIGFKDTKGSFVPPIRTCNSRDPIGTRDRKRPLLGVGLIEEGLPREQALWE